VDELSRQTPLTSVKENVAQRRLDGRKRWAGHMVERRVCGRGFSIEVGRFD
jgi:hypothetical protein